MYYFVEVCATKQKTRLTVSGYGSCYTLNTGILIVMAVIVTVGAGRTVIQPRFISITVYIIQPYLTTSLPEMCIAK